MANTKSKENTSHEEVMDVSESSSYEDQRSKKKSKKSRKLPDLNMEKLDLSKDNLTEFLKRFHARCYIHEIEENEEICRSFLNLMPDGSEAFDYVYENSVLEEQDWEVVRNGFIEKFMLTDIKTNSLHNILAFKWSNTDNLESARLSFTKLVNNTNENLDNTFVCLSFVKSLPKPIYKNFVLVYKGSYEEGWVYIYDQIKRAYSIENQLSHSNHSHASSLADANSSEHHVAHFNNIKKGNNHANRSRSTDNTYNKKQIPCRFFQKGYCKKGTECDFSHDVKRADKKDSNKASH